MIVKRSERLHWSRESAVEEAQGWADELTNPNPAGKIEWRNVDYNMAIGLVDQPNYTAVARSMLLTHGFAIEFAGKRDSFRWLRAPLWHFIPA